MWARAVALWCCCAGCAEILGIKDLPPDGPADAPAQVCEAVGGRCEGDVLHRCRVVGEVEEAVDCELGCLTSPGAHCARLVPAANGATADDVIPDPELFGVSFASNVLTTMNSDDGSISNLRPAGIGVINGIGFQVRGNVGIFRFKGIILNTDATVRILGSRSAVLIATELGLALLSGAVLDVRGTCSGPQPGPGGFSGGVAATEGLGGGGGVAGGGAGVGTAAEASGGAGGGHGGPGGDGGIAPTNTIPKGGAVVGNLAINALFGGGGGGGGGTATGGPGGGGGGAVQLISNTSILLGDVGGAVINAGGCGGRGAQVGGGGGGGAGGTILLEAHDVVFALGTVLAANGGGGAGGGTNSGKGADGTANATPANGGTGTGGAGGSGGAAAATSGAPGADNADNAGGGGGAAGRIRINTITTPVIPGSVVISPQLGTTASLGTLTVE